MKILRYDDAAGRGRVVPLAVVHFLDLEGRDRGEQSQNRGTVGVVAPQLQEIEHVYAIHQVGGRAPGCVVDHRRGP